MRFAVSYSFGKTCALALWRMLQQGHEPVCLVTTVNGENDRSWSHGMDATLRQAVSDSLGIPLLPCVCDAGSYSRRFEETLALARQMGAEACVFGDVDIEEHGVWNRSRCAAAGLQPLLPLWQRHRGQVAGEILGSGIQAVVKCTQHPYREFLGRSLSASFLREIYWEGADLCGKNGEYHTFVYDGPMFSWPVDIKLGQKVAMNTHSLIDIGLEPSAWEIEMSC